VIAVAMSWGLQEAMPVMSALASAEKINLYQFNVRFIGSSFDDLEIGIFLGQLFKYRIPNAEMRLLPEN
jgi:hypothetical protein